MSEQLESKAWVEVGDEELEIYVFFQRYSPPLDGRYEITGHFDCETDALRLQPLLRLRLEDGSKWRFTVLDECRLSMGRRKIKFGVLHQY